MVIFAHQSNFSSQTLTFQGKILKLWWLVVFHDTKIILALQHPGTV